MSAEPGINLILCCLKIPVTHYTIPGLQEAWGGRTRRESTNWKQHNSACEKSNGRNDLPCWL